MKRVRFPETLMVLINILIVTQSGRLKQMNYLELYNKCLGDYGVMYKTLNEEINSYYKREQSLLETVKNTVILAYQKTQLAEETFRKSKEEWDKTVLDLDKKIKELEMQLKNEIELKEESLKENSFLKEKIITLNKEIENKFK